ncbi:MCE family protein [Solihabitans fulvus]|uniref:MCE family protein n=1 Tax=Solihabitans fulvus TaxID=1892852 RepID=A0A5B2WFR2_9PSEU|nr:MCE family protein [Solihabitans fulvus]KAA2250175.1 MCE family protein [Solihabitans fulvus]
MTFRERNPVTIGLVSLTAIALALLAAFFSDDLPIIGGGVGYQAEFREAAGLKPQDQVQVAGIKVGKVTDVRLVRDHVVVSFRVRDAWLGDQTVAAIKIQTLLGQKVLALDPQGSGPLDPGTAIPLAHTLSPYDVVDAFNGLAGTIQGIDTTQLAQSFQVLTDTFHNTPNQLRGTLDGLSALSRTISSRDTQLSVLLSNTSRISHTLADRDGEFAKIIGDGGLLFAELQQRKDAISALLTGTRNLADQLTGLVDDNTAQLGPTLSQLNDLAGMLRANQDALAQGIRQLAPFARLFNNTAGNGRWIDSYICGLTAGQPGGNGC